MIDTGQNDARSWLVERLTLRIAYRVAGTLDRFNRQVDAGADSREALAAYIERYQENCEWIGAFFVFLNRRVESLGEYARWRIADEQYRQAINSKMELPQFSAVKNFLRSKKRLDAIHARNSPKPGDYSSAPEIHC